MTSATGRPDPRSSLRTGSPSPATYGFTLIELLVVLAIVALVAGLAPVALDRALPGRRTEAAARRVMAAIRDLQSESITSGHSDSVEIEAGGSTLRVGKRRLVFSATTHLTLTGPDGQPLAVLRLFPDGSAQGAHIRVIDETHEKTVSVSGLTGEVWVEARQ